MTAEATHWLLDQGIKVMGIDAITFDPPVWAIYSIPDKPLTPESTNSEAIHHPGFGKVLKEEMDKLGIECKLRHKDDGQNVNGDMVNFLLKYLYNKILYYLYVALI